MSEDAPFEPPEITDDDIVWASELLGLPRNAFYGEDGADPRQEVLRSMGRIDVAACPGSGKTTLLIAKLAILARKWRYRTRGICVLSHTNAARNEIETSLGSTAAGRSLLGYPHFIGTIHAFVDQFLALPMLRSLGYRSIQFSTEIAGQKLWVLTGHGSQLPRYLYGKIKNGDRRKAAVCHAHYVGEDLDLILEADNTSVKLLRSSASESFNIIDEWKRGVHRERYAAYEDTFAYGHQALKKHGDLAGTICDRFPLLFIDEAQDNSEAQAEILKRIFADGSGTVVCQRLGDANQAIFDSVIGKEATTESFPSKVQIDLPSSHRFGQEIADLADPLGISPYGLVGHGPRWDLASGVLEGRHTIFLFDESSSGKVLDAYGELLIRTFSEEELRAATFTAVGQVHRPPDKEERHKFPHHVGHYWPDYDPALSSADPKPQSFVQYVLSGQARAKALSATHPAVEKIAEGILRLAGMAEGETTLRRRRHCHRYVLHLLEENAAVQARYKVLQSRLALRRKLLTQGTWDNRWCVGVRQIAEAIAGVSLTSAEADTFMEWRGESNASASRPTNQRSRDNIYRFPANDPKVEIRVGSIHSVKGETHTASLVLETFWYQHNLDKLKPWIVGPKSGWKRADTERQRSRLKLHYVAMTRPTHLLCLAMKLSTFETSDGEPDQEVIAKLEQRGWHVEYVRSGAVG